MSVRPLPPGTVTKKGSGGQARGPTSFTLFLGFPTSGPFLVTIQGRKWRGSGRILRQEMFVTCKNAGLDRLIRTPQSTMTGRSTAESGLGQAIMDMSLSVLDLDVNRNLAIGFVLPNRGAAFVAASEIPRGVRLFLVPLTLP